MLIPPTYTKIVEGCIRREPLAQRRLYELFSPKMMALCYRYAQNRDEAEDMLQEGFIKVFQCIDKYNHQGSLEGWVRRIIVNTAIDIIRRNKSLQLVSSLNENIIESTVDDNIVDALEVEYLLNIIQDLPDGYRIVFNMFAIEGYSHAEIGEQLNINESTSRSQFTRAKVLLKKRIHEDSLVINKYQDAI